MKGDMNTGRCILFAGELDLYGDVVGKFGKFKLVLLVQLNGRE